MWRVNAKRIRLNYKLKPDVDTAQETTQDWTMMLATLAVCSGTALVLSGADIWNAPVYDMAKNIPGSPHSWGFVLLMAGLMMFYGMFSGRRFFMISGTLLGVLWNLFFGLSFVDEAFKGNLGWSTVFIYFFLMGGHMITFDTYRKPNAL